METYVCRVASLSFDATPHVKEHCSGVYTVTAIEVAHKAIR